MKSSTQAFVSLVAALATLSQSAIATPSSREMSQNAIDSYQLTGKKLSLPGKSELQPSSLIAQQSDICKPGTIPVRINAPDNATPAYSGTLQPGVNSGTRCIFFKDVSLSVRANSTKTWLIIHGWLNSSDSEDIKALALEVARQNPGDRVLMLDWGEAARNGGNTQIPKVGDVGSLGVYYAASWIRPIAEAVVDKLKSDYGLTEQEASQNLNIVGHSLGTLMAGEIGAVYSGMTPKGEKDNNGSPINSIIALDPPSETTTALNLGGYDVDGRTPAYTFKGKNFLGASQRDPHPEAIDRPKKFSDVSRFSRAFVGAKSLAGNQEFASWAHESFQMDFGNISDTGDEHGRVVKAFTNLISEHPFKQPNSKNRFLDLSDMRAHNNCKARGSSYFMKCNTIDGKHEGTIEVNSSNTLNSVKFTMSSGEKQQIAATQSANPKARKIVESSSNCQSAISQIRYSLPSSIVNSVRSSKIETFSSGQPKQKEQVVSINIQGLKGYDFMLAHTNTNLLQISRKVVKSCPRVGLISFFLLNSRMERSYGLVNNKVIYFPCVNRREANEWGKNMCL